MWTEVEELSSGVTYELDSRDRGIKTDVTERKNHWPIPKPVTNLSTDNTSQKNDFQKSTSKDGVEFSMMCPTLDNHLEADSWQDVGFFLGWGYLNKATA